jgi:hypothetical protein
MKSVIKFAQDAIIVPPATAMEGLEAVGERNVTV